MSKCPQVAEKEPSLTEDDVDELSSDGSGHFSGGYPETSPVPVPVCFDNDIPVPVPVCRDNDLPIPIPMCRDNDLPTLLAGIAALARGQGILLEKLTFLEKSMGTVQFDMTFLRDDMEAVHQAMERFGDFVCDVQDAAVEAGRVNDKAPLDGSPRLEWKGKEQVAEHTRAPIASTPRGEPAHGGDAVADEVAWIRNGENFTEETQSQLEEHELHPHTLDLTNTGRRDWGYERGASPEWGSPPSAQVRVSIEKEDLMEESQTIEMSYQSSHPQTPAKLPPMWSDFAHTVKDWRPPADAGIDSDDGRLSSKKGRWDTPEHEEDDDGTVGAQLVDVHSALNLNLLPDKQVLVLGTGGEGTLLRACACQDQARTVGVEHGEALQLAEGPQRCNQDTKIR